MFALPTQAHLHPLPIFLSAWLLFWHRWGGIARKAVTAPTQPAPLPFSTSSLGELLPPKASQTWPSLTHNPWPQSARLSNFPLLQLELMPRSLLYCA